MECALFVNQLGVMINRIRKGLRFSAYSVVIGFSVGHFVLTTVGSVAAVGGSSM